MKQTKEQPTAMQFSDYESGDFRKAIGGINKELSELQALKVQLSREKRTIETVMYMLYPKEAMRDGYMTATGSIAQRLRRAKEEENRPVKFCEVDECNQKVLCRGLCYTHYGEERKKIRRKEKVAAGSSRGPMVTPEMRQILDRLNADEIASRAD